MDKLPQISHLLAQAQDFLMLLQQHGQEQHLEREGMGGILGRGQVLVGAGGDGTFVPWQSLQSCCAWIPYALAGTAPRVRYLPSFQALRSVTTWYAMLAVTRAHRSMRSGLASGLFAAFIHRPTETWQSGESATVFAMSARVLGAEGTYVGSAVDA